MRLLIPLILIFILSCKSESPITIVDIGRMNRLELGSQLEKINKMNPRVMALDIFFNNDSLESDKNLINAFSQISNGVQVVQLMNFKSETNQWDSIRTSHAKFNLGTIGYANLITKGDRILETKILLLQKYEDQLIPSFCYVIAENSFGVKSQFKGMKDQAFEIQIKNFGEGYQVISYQDLLADNFDSNLITDRIVIFGNTDENEDYYFVNSLKTRGLSGVEVHASFLARLIDN